MAAAAVGTVVRVASPAVNSRRHSMRPTTRSPSNGIRCQRTTGSATTTRLLAYERTSGCHSPEQVMSTRRCGPR